MQGHVHACLLRHGNDSLEEVFQAAPDPLFAHLAPLRESLILSRLIVEFADQGAASLRDVRPGPVPPEAGHPVVADHGDADLSERLDRGDLVFDLLVASGQAELDFLRRYRMALHSGNGPASGLEIRLDLFESLDVILSLHSLLRTEALPQWRG